MDHPIEILDGDDVIAEVNENLLGKHVSIIGGGSLRHRRQTSKPEDLKEEKNILASVDLAGMPANPRAGLPFSWSADVMKFMASSKQAGFKHKWSIGIKELKINLFASIKKFLEISIKSVFCLFPGC